MLVPRMESSEHLGWLRMVPELRHFAGFEASWLRERRPPHVQCRTEGWAPRVPSGTEARTVGRAFKGLRGNTRLPTRWRMAGHWRWQASTNGWLSVPLVLAVVLTLLFTSGGSPPSVTAVAAIGPVTLSGTGHPTSSLAATAMLEAAENSIASGSGPLGGGQAGCGASGMSPKGCDSVSTVAPAPAAGSYDGWGNLTPYLNLSPSARLGAAMIYDGNPSDGYVVLFGGMGPHGPLGDTWEFHDGSWTNVTPIVPNGTNTPSPRYGATMAYDSSDGYVVLFGGASAAFSGSNDPLLNDTWTFLHGVWTQQCVSCIPGKGEPGPRFESSTSDDPSESGVVLFGGLAIQAGNFTALNDTWVFAGGSWTLLSPTLSPPARYGGGLSLNATGGSVVLFGGCAQTLRTAEPTCTSWLGDQWTFSAGAWSESAVTPGAPGARMNFGFALAPTENFVLAFGGLSPAGPLNETWELDQGVWTDLTTTLLWSPSPRYDASLSYDSASGTNSFVLFGGWNGTYLGETWVYPSPFSPLRVSAPVAVPAVTDSGHPIRLNITVLGGAGGYDRTWFGLPAGCTTANSSSLVCHPSPPEEASESSAVVVRVRDAQGSIVWSPATVVQVNSPLSAYIAPTVVGQTNQGTVPFNVSLTAVLYGGTAPFAFAWDWGDGSPNSSGNPVTHEYTAVGNFSVKVIVSDSQGDSFPAVYDERTALPLAASLTVSPSTPATGTSVTLQAHVTGGFPPYSYVWSGLPASCSSADSPSLSCSPDASGTYVVSVHVSANVGGTVTCSTTMVVHATFSFPWIEFLAGVGVSLVVAVWAVRRARRKRSRPAETATTQSSGTPPPP